MGEGNENGQGEDEAKEPNSFRNTLVGCRDNTIPNARDAVYDGNGTPIDAIATPIANGGWVCSKADDWVQELRDRCSDLLGPFDDAVDTVSQRIRNEPDQVPEGDWRGLSWSRSWSMQQRLI